MTNYLPIVPAFLAEHFGSREVALEMVGVRDANQFVLREARRLSRSRAKLVVTVQAGSDQGALPEEVCEAITNAIASALRLPQLDLRAHPQPRPRLPAPPSVPEADATDPNLPKPCIC